MNVWSSLTTMLRTRRGALSCLALLSIPLSACSLWFGESYSESANDGGYNPAIEGRVFEADSGQPLPGAFVIAVWSYSGSDGVGSRSGCSRLEIVQSDAQGRYVIPAGSARTSRNTRRGMLVFLAGYEEAHPLRVSREEQERQKPMRKYEGTGDDRLFWYQRFGSLRICSPNDHEKLLKFAEKLRPVYLAISEEAKTLQVSPDKRDGLRAKTEFYEWYGSKEYFAQPEFNKK
ncbi:MAG: carboxypeptidase regulatory-like domain-containing protein [Betaproteobacteria bacterium]|nr:carboxypeptidase regulatory-like domain-containing protein [Betaproteobacteria bacterium]